MSPRPFEGRLVRLRAKEEPDLEFVYQWINDWETIKYLGQRYPRGHEFEKTWLANNEPSGTEGSYIIETLAEGRPIGWLGLHNASPEDRVAELGIAIGDHDFLDGGFGTDAMRVACTAGFDVMNLHKVELTVYDWNPRAIRVYEKVGFKHEGVLRQGIFKAGRWHDLVFMGLLRHELVRESE